MRTNNGYPDQYGIGTFRYNSTASQWQQLAPVVLDNSGNTLAAVTAGPTGNIVMESYGSGGTSGSTVYVSPGNVNIFTADSSGSLSLSVNSSATLRLDNSNISLFPGVSGIPGTIIQSVDDTQDTLRVVDTGNNPVASLKPSGIYGKPTDPNAAALYLDGSNLNSGGLLIDLENDGTVLKVDRSGTTTISNGTMTNVIQSSQMQIADSNNNGNVLVSSDFGVQSGPPSGQPAFQASGIAGATTALDMAGLDVDGNNGNIINVNLFSGNAVQINDGLFTVFNLPSSDPHSNGRVWVNSGVLTVSTG